MNKNVIITIKKELRAILRDKRSLLMMLVMPLIIPVFIFIFSAAYNDIAMESNVPELTNVGINYNMNDDEQLIAKEVQLNPVVYHTKEELEAGYKNHEYSAYVIREDNNYTIYANINEENGMEANAIAQNYLDAYNIYLGKNKLDQIGIKFEDIFTNVNYEVSELSGHNTLVDLILSLGMVFAIMSVSLSAIYCVTDSTAGEKERGTLETFLTFPIRSNELIIGKYFATVIASLITAIISLVLLVVTIGVSSNMFEMYQSATFNLNFTSIMIAFTIMGSYAFFVSGACIAIASFSKSYKEAQSALTPISFVTMIPMFLNIFEVPLNYVISCIPVVGHTMLLDYLLTSNLSEFNFLYLILCVVTTIVFSIILVKIITKMYKSEKVLFQN